MEEPSDSTAAVAGYSDRTSEHCHKVQLLQSTVAGYSDRTSEHCHKVQLLQSDTGYDDGFQNFQRCLVLQAFHYFVLFFFWMFVLTVSLFVCVNCLCLSLVQRSR